MQHGLFLQTVVPNSHTIEFESGGKLEDTFESAKVM